jgi:hypothetical protein
VLDLAVQSLKQYIRVYGILVNGIAAVRGACTRQMDLAGLAEIVQSLQSTVANLQRCDAARVQEIAVLRQQLIQARGGAGAPADREESPDAAAAPSSGAAQPSGAALALQQLHGLSLGDEAQDPNDAEPDAGPDAPASVAAAGAAAGPAPAPPRRRETLQPAPAAVRRIVPESTHAQQVQFHDETSFDGDGTSFHVFSLPRRPRQPRGALLPPGLWRRAGMSCAEAERPDNPPRQPRPAAAEGAPPWPAAVRVNDAACCDGNHPSV